MCGIIAITSNKNCFSSIFSGLKSLEYRGYDSSGIAFVNNSKLSQIKSVGKIDSLKKKYNKKNISKTIIGHTRWATHGKPSQKNAHPFIKDNCALVHNGIIENFKELTKLYSINKKSLISETDSEVIASIFNKILKKLKDPINSLKELSKNIEGTYAFAIIIKNSNSVYAICKGSPLLIGTGKDFCSLSSDILGLPESTKKVIFLEDNDITEINDKQYFIYNKNKKVVRKKYDYTNKNNFSKKDKFNYFMEKEIHHQPTSIKNTILNFANKNSKEVFLPNSLMNFNKIKNIHFSACGTAYHACLIAKYWLEDLSEISTSIEIASEYRYRKLKHNKNSIGIVVSQSGETMDTLESLKKYKENNIFTACIVNVINSTIARKSDFVLPTLAGPEIGVASTKAFTSQLIVLALLSLHIKNQKKITFFNDKKIFNFLFEISKLLKNILENVDKIKKIVPKLKKAKSIFYIGRGTMYPLALEGALKLKEITYKHCEGYAGGELKHGPLALIEKNIPVIVLAPFNKNFRKLLSNIQEIKARGGKIILITDKKGLKEAKNEIDYFIIMPESNLITAPIIYALPIQLIAFYLGVLLGTNVDQPRNLAKSVTVE